MRKQHHWYVSVKDATVRGGAKRSWWFVRKSDAYDLFQTLNRAGVRAWMGDEGEAPIYSSKATNGEQLPL